MTTKQTIQVYFKIKSDHSYESAKLACKSPQGKGDTDTVCGASFAVLIEQMGPGALGKFHREALSFKPAGAEFHPESRAVF